MDPMFKEHPLLSRLTLLILLPIVVLCIFTFNQLKLSLSPKEGQLHLAGLSKAVDVTFDNQGTPTVVAQTDLDAFYTQGYLHASERMWQMELQRRLVEGRLSEVFGTVSVPSDVWMRTLGLFNTADQQWHNLSENAQKALQAYSDGVNTWLATTKDHGPEFRVFGITPEKWQPVDSLAWQKVLALNLGQNMHGELARLNALKTLDGRQLQTFFPYDEYTEQTTVTAGNSTTDNKGNTSKQATFTDWQDIQNHFRRHWALGERFAGSNAWVVSGQYTQSGAPMLANDPHLGIQMPSVWYAISLHGEKLNATGMSLVGLPGVMLGRNRHISWGVTNLMGDVQDLFILDIPLDNNQVYQTDQGLKPITSRFETIDIAAPSPQFLNKKVLPITIEVRQTHLGPIVSDVVTNAEDVMALRWSALDADDTSFESFFNLQYAQDWSQFRSALTHLGAPALHFVYADTQGNIGAQVAGHMAIRGQGQGTLPQRAFQSSALWQGYTDFDRLPHQYNPQNGFIVSANTFIASEQDVVLSHEWANPYRKQRIEQLLEAQIAQDKKFSEADMQQMQVDYIDLGAKQLLPFFTDKALMQTLLNDSPKHQDAAEQALALLSDWNASFDVQSTGASIYHYWLSDLLQQIFNDELSPVWRVGPSPTADLAAMVNPQTLKQLLSMKQSPWCDSPGCQTEMVNSFNSAMAKLKKQSGSDDPQDWNWGSLHHVDYVHQPFGQVKLLDKVFKTRVEIGGSADTVNASGAIADNRGGYQQTLGSTFRQIFDLAQSEGGAYIIATGQSGMFMSDHYDDMIEPFAKGEIFHYQNRQTAQQQAHKLQLLPGNP